MQKNVYEDEYCVKFVPKKLQLSLFFVVFFRAKFVAWVKDISIYFSCKK